MTDDRKSGIALIAGSLGGILTMAIHPSPAGPLTVQQAAQLSVHSGVAHAIAIASVVVLFLGACGFARSIAAADRLSFAGIVIFGFACAAVMIAATVSGFIVTSILQRMVHDDPATLHQWQMVIFGVFQMNQAFSRIYSVAASIAIILWCASSLRNGGLGRGVAIYGGIISVLIVVGICAGHLQLDVHGMTVVWLGQAIWFMLVGSQLYSRTSGGSPAQ